MQIVATTDVLLRERRHDKGSVFDVGDDEADGFVDAGTAARWLQLGWADRLDDAGDGASGMPSPPAPHEAPAQAPTAERDPLPQAGEGKRR